ncbi:hypothetical protein [Streptomyces sp. NPDC002738]
MTLNLPRPRWPGYEIAVIGGQHEDDLAVAGGYLSVAEIAATHWSLHGPDDSLPIPILYNYRHSVELSLKWLIRFAAGIIRRGAYDTRGKNLSHDKVDEKLRDDSHSIRKLAERLNRYLGLIPDLDPPNNRIDAESFEALKWLDAQDETGETFRYSMIGRGRTAGRPARPRRTSTSTTTSTGYTSSPCSCRPATPTRSMPSEICRTSTCRRRGRSTCRRCVR